MLVWLSRCWSDFDLKIILQCQNHIPKQRAPPIVIRLPGNCYGAPHSDLAPRELFPLAPLLTPQFPRAEFSKSKSDLTFVAMSPTSIMERQFCLFNKAHKNKISFSRVFHGKEVSRSPLTVMSSKTILMKRHNCATYQSTRQSAVKGTHTVSKHPQLLLHIHSHFLSMHCNAGEFHFFAAFMVCALFLKCSKRLSAASRKASFTILPSLNGFSCLARTWLTRHNTKVALRSGFWWNWLPLKLHFQIPHFCGK